MSSCIHQRRNAIALIRITKNISDPHLVICCLKTSPFTKHQFYRHSMQARMNHALHKRQKKANRKNKQMINQRVSRTEEMQAMANNTILKINLTPLKFWACHCHEMQLFTHQSRVMWSITWDLGCSCAVWKSVRVTSYRLAPAQHFLLPLIPSQFLKFWK